jgi:prepilin-type N-terminal cleavage/methylation domain-containing protein
MRTLRKNDGFTLIELMIVVVIIGILAAIAIPKFTQVSNGAKQAEAEPILKQICSLAEAEKLKDGAWPDDLADIPGWEAPTAKHFSAFAFTKATGVASATKGTTGAKDASMDCTTKEITVS